MRVACYSLIKSLKNYLKELVWKFHFISCSNISVNCSQNNVHFIDKFPNKHLLNEFTRATFPISFIFNVQKVFFFVQVYTIYKMVTYHDKYYLLWINSILSLIKKNGNSFHIQCDLLIMNWIIKIQNKIITRSESEIKWNVSKTKMFSKLVDNFFALIECSFLVFEFIDKMIRVSVPKYLAFAFVLIRFGLFYFESMMF